MADRFAAEGEIVSEFKGRHFPGEIVLWAVRWYCRYGISYRDLEEMMTERGSSVDHSTIYRWVQRYAPVIEMRLRWQWRRPGSTSWHVDELDQNVSTGSIVSFSWCLPWSTAAFNTATSR